MENIYNYRFGSFTYTPSTGGLNNGNNDQTLKPKDSHVLNCLLENSGRLVSKTNLLKTAWPDTVVDEGVLKASIRRLRKTLGDDYRAPKCSYS